jgi:hypothetical protein
MNKKRQTSHLLLLLSVIAIIGAVSFSTGQILHAAAAQVGKSSSAGVANPTSANNAISSYLPPFTKSIIDQTRNTNATKYALHNAISATTAAMNKTAGMNATNATSAAAGMNKTAGMNASALKSVLGILRNTNATSFGAQNIINVTKNTTAVKH